MLGLSRERFALLIKTLSICVLAAAANLLFIAHIGASPLVLVLFQDTVFTAAVAFALGPIPGIAAAALTWAAYGVWLGFHPFLPVAVAEVLLICRLKPAPPAERIVFRTRDPILRERSMVSLVSVLASLALLYLACAFAASVLGGAIESLRGIAGGAQNPDEFLYYTAIRIGLLQTGVSALPASIVSRLLVNMADRFFVVFGGYLISLGIKWAMNFGKKGTSAPRETTGARAG